MDDFEYSVEIGDRDWASFFAECEECDLLPPSLAGLDDSGMSDMDDPFLAQRAQRVDSTLDFSEQDQPRDSPPDCEGSPVGHCSGKQGLSGIDSVLSGSEEDIHMQSINIFFEKLKGLTEVQPSQERAGNKKEAKQVEQHWCKGQQAGRRTLPINCAKLNTPPAGAGKEVAGPVDTIRNLNPIKNIGAQSNVSSKPAASCDSAPVVCKSTETEIFTKEETAVKEMTQWNPSHHSAEKAACSENTPQFYKMELCRSMDDTDQETSSQDVLSKKSRVREDHIPTHKMSPSVSLRRKRRKKRPLSMEGGGDEEVRENHVSVKHNSKEELQALKEGERLSLSQETFDCLKEPKNGCKSLYNLNSSVSNLLEDLSVQDATPELPPSVSLSESLHRRFSETSSAKSSNHMSETHLSPSKDHLLSAPCNGADAAIIQPCSKLQLKESAGGNQFSWLQVSVTETEKSKSQKQNVKGEDLHQSDQIKASICDCKNEQDLKDPTVEVKSVSLSSEPCAPGEEVSQNVNLSTAKSVLAAEPGHSGRDKHTRHQSQAEPQQQLENNCHNSYHCHTALENTHFSEITSYSLLDESLKEDMCTISDINQSPVGCLSKNLSGAKTEQQIDCLTEVLTSDILSESFKKVEKTPFEISQLDLTSQNPETKVSLCDDLKTNPPGVVLVSPQSVVSNSNENSTDYSPATEHESDQEGKKTIILAKHDKHEAEEAIAASKDVNMPVKAASSVHAMSSFWNEMEKLTINDILGLRQISKALPPLQEGEETEVFPEADSGVFTEMEESKSEQITEEMTDSSSIRAVSWESEPVPVSRGSDVYPERGVLTSVSDSSQPVLTERAQKCLGNISKTVSMHNLQALDPQAFGYTCQKETIQILEKLNPENFDLTENAAVNKSKDNFLPSSSTESYSISFTDIFQYFFGGKQSVSSQSAPDDATTHHYTSGKSVPETYDNFFSEFDNESFFYPLTTAEEQNKDKPVPVFSYSRSTGRNLQFPEAYEHFFASSSSDDSSVESEEEDTSSPVRVVSRFTRKASSNQLFKDTYENFFTDKDLKEDFFSLKSLSFRKINFTAPAVQDQNLDSLVPVRQSSRLILKIDSHLNMLGNPDVMLPDPLLYHLEGRISKQLALKPFRYEDLQVSNPRLDAPFLPLKQSDMCLVCIAFASWVLKTANPQVGDAWKAVLLANVSALSAIRYLRKYVRTEAATSEMKQLQNALTDS